MDVHIHTRSEAHTHSQNAKIYDRLHTICFIRWCTLTHFSYQSFSVFGENPYVSPNYGWWSVVVCLRIPMRADMCVSMRERVYVRNSMWFALMCVCAIVCLCIFGTSPCNRHGFKKARNVKATKMNQTN